MISRVAAARGGAGAAMNVVRRTAQKNAVGRYAMRHPLISAAGGMMVAGGIASGRRRSGLDKPVGRPTGIYGY